MIEVIGNTRARVAKMSCKTPISGTRAAVNSTGHKQLYDSGLLYDSSIYYDRWGSAPVDGQRAKIEGLT